MREGGTKCNTCGKTFYLRISSEITCARCKSNDIRNTFFALCIGIIIIYILIIK